MLSGTVEWIRSLSDTETVQRTMKHPRSRWICIATAEAIATPPSSLDPAGHPISLTQFMRPHILPKFPPNITHRSTFTSQMTSRS